jgi:PAS domain S-box-containing protein
MTGESRAPRALLLTRTDSCRNRLDAALHARGWTTDHADWTEAGPLLEHSRFELMAVEFTADESCSRVQALCRAARSGAGHLLVVAEAGRIEEAAGMVAEGPGDLLIEPFTASQLEAFIALAEARIRPTASGTTCRDVATEPHVEITFRHGRASVDELFRYAPEGIAIVDHEDRVVRINDEFGRMFGYTPEQTIGRAINDLIAPTHLLDEAQALTGEVRTRRRRVQETLRRRRDGTLLDVSILAAPISLGEGLKGAFAIYRDISERRTQERALQASESRYRALFDEAERVNVELLERTREIEMAMAAKNRLYSALNHELRTPISAVMLYQELLLTGSMGPLLPDQREALERSHTAARHLLDVVRDVLDLSRSEAGPQGVRVTRVEVGRLLQRPRPYRPATRRASRVYGAAGASRLRAGSSYRPAEASPDSAEPALQCCEVRACGAH